MTARWLSLITGGVVGFWMAAAEICRAREDVTRVWTEPNSYRRRK